MRQQPNPINELWKSHKEHDINLPPPADYTPPVTPTFPFLYTSDAPVEYTNGTDVYYV